MFSTSSSISAAAAVSTESTSRHQPPGAFCFETSLSSGRYSSTPHNCLAALASHCIRITFGDRVQLVADALQTIGATTTSSCSEPSAVTLSALWTLLQRKQQSVTTYVSSSGCEGPSHPQQQHSSSSSSSQPASSATQKKKAMELAFVRAALLVLIQHSIVSVRRKPRNQKQPKSSLLLSASGAAAAAFPYAYLYHPERAVRLGGCRYARYVDFMQRALQDPTAAIVVETLLLHGRLRTIDLVLQSVQQQQVQQQQEQPSSSTDPSISSSSAPSHHKYTARETVVDAMAKLVRGGFLEQVTPISCPVLDNDDDDDDEDVFEREIKASKPPVVVTSRGSSLKKRPTAIDDDDEQQKPPAKKVKIELTDEMEEKEKQNQSLSFSTTTTTTTLAPMDDDPAVIQLLRSNAQYKAALPVDTVWRVNQGMFHDSLRALRLGRLVAELYNHRVRWAGSLVTGALKYRAHLEHHRVGVVVVPTTATSGGTSSSAGGGGGSSSGGASDTTFFTPNDVVKYLPKSVVQLMDTEASKTGVTVVQIMYKAFLDLSQIRLPAVVVRRVGEDSFEIAHASLLDYLRRRIIHQVVEDRHGQVAARIMEILWYQGWLESDHLANTAMVPAKEARAILHELYRSRYIDLFQISTSHSSKQYFNHNASIYLWCVHPARVKQRVTDNVLTATRNLSVRRQHEAEVVGREWIERAQRQQQMQDGDNNENEHETDKLNYQKFCLGLERIDVALHQLDETLLAMADF